MACAGSPLLLRLSPAVVRGAMLWCMGCSLQWILLLQGVLRRHMGSVAAASWLYSTGSGIVAHRLRCSGACRIFPDQGSNLCLLHWSADSLPLRHQESPNYSSLMSSNIHSLSSPPSLVDTSHKSLELCDCSTSFSSYCLLCMEGTGSFVLETIPHIEFC